MNRLILINNLSKKYNEQILFKNVNIEIFDRGIYGLKGESGTGKSTLLHIISLLENGYEGEITFLDKKYSKIKDKESFIYENIGNVFQNTILFPDLTLEENLKLSGSFNEKRLNELLQRLDLFSKKKILAKRLSGGERLRLSLVRSLLNSPSILLLDEPTASLDEYNSKIVMDFLKEESRYRTIFIVSHNEELLDTYADVLFELKNQSIIKIKENNIFEANNYDRKNNDNKLSFLFILKYIYISFSRKRFKSMILIFSLFLSFFVVGFSFSLSYDVSKEVSTSLNSLMDDDQVILKTKNITNESKDVISVDEIEVKEVINYSSYFYDYGYIYSANFEEMFCDANYLSMVGKNNLTFYEVGLRSVSETIAMNDIPSNITFYPKRINVLQDDEIVLGLRKKDIKKICKELGLNNLNEESLSTYLKSNTIDFCFYFSNSSWGYYNEVLFRLKSFFVVDDQIVLAHSNQFFTTDFFENKMKLPYSNNLSEIDYYPWTIKKQIYIKSDYSDIENAIKEYLTSYYYELYDLEILKGNISSFAFSSAFHKGKFLMSYSTSNKVALDSLNKYKNNIETIFPTGDYYPLIESALVSGFKNSIFFSSNEDDLSEIEYYFNDLEENVDTLDISSFDFGENITYGNLISSAMKKGVKLDHKMNKLLYGRVPEGIDEFAISSSLAYKLFGDIEKAINSKIYIILSNYNYDYGNTFLHTHLNVSGVYEGNEERIYQEEYWYPIFLVSRLEYSLKSIQINSFLCSFKKDYDISTFMDKRFVIVNPLKEIKSSIDMMIDMIENVLFIFTILLSVSAFGVSLISIESSIKESLKEIGLLKALGIKKTSIFKLYFLHNVYFLIIAYFLASINLLFISKIAFSLFFNNPISFDIYFVPYLVMLLLGVITVIPITLIYVVPPLFKKSGELIKRYY